MQLDAVAQGCELVVGEPHRRAARVEWRVARIVDDGVVHPRQVRRVATGDGSGGCGRRAVERGDEVDATGRAAGDANALRVDEEGVRVEADRRAGRRCGSRCDRGRTGLCAAAAAGRHEDEKHAWNEGASDGTSVLRRARHGYRPEMTRMVAAAALLALLAGGTAFA